MKKVTACLLLISVMLLLCGQLAGCIVRNETPDADSTAVSMEDIVQKAVTVDNDHPQGLAALLTSIAVGQRTLDLNYYGTAQAGGYLWFYGKDTAADVSVLAGIAVSGGESVVLELTLPAEDARLVGEPPEGERISIGYQPVSAEGDRPFLLRSVEHLEDSDEVYHSLYTEYQLCSVTETGVVYVIGPLETEQGDYIQSAFEYDGLLWCCISRWNETKDLMLTPQLRCYSTADGTVTAKAELPSELLVQDMQVLADGGLLLLGYLRDDLSSTVTKPTQLRFYTAQLNDEQILLGAPVKLPDQLITAMVDIAPAQNTELIWLKTASGLYSWDMSTNTYTLQHRWADVGSNIPAETYVFSDKCIALLNYSYNPNLQETVGELWLLGEETAMPLDARPAVTIGVMDYASEDLSAAIASFNMRNGELRAELKVYTYEEAAKNGVASSQELLNRDVLQGVAPDVLIGLQGAALEQLAGKGVLLDMYPLLDADEDFDRGDFVAGPMKAGEINGALYSVISSYGILTTVGSEKTLGDRMGWSWEEYDRLTAGGAIPYYGFGRSTILNYQLSLSDTRFVDYAAGKARLDSPEFIALLKASATYPEEMPYYIGQDVKELFSSGQALTAVCILPGFANVRNDVYIFDGPVVYKGFAGYGNSSSAITPMLQLSINASSTDPAAAWQFVRFFLTPEYQSGLTSLPLRRDTLADMAAAAQQPGETGSGVPTYLAQSEQSQSMLEYWARGLTQEETDKIVALAEATTVALRSDSVVADILAEEVADFYNGIRTAEETAALIQSRVQTYLAEQG